MGDEFWRVHFVEADEPQPELWINKDVDGLLSAIQGHDPKVTAGLIPAVLRQVLLRLVDDAAAWTDEGMLGKWLMLTKTLHADEFEAWDEEEEAGSRQARRDWVDQVVTLFAELGNPV